MMKNIELWIDNVMEEAGTYIHLEVVPTPRGWSAKIMADGYILLDSNGESFMIKEGSTVQQALEKLDRICVDDLNKMMHTV